MWLFAAVLLIMACLIVFMVYGLFLIYLDMGDEIKKRLKQSQRD